VCEGPARTFDNRSSSTRRSPPLEPAERVRPDSCYKACLLATVELAKELELKIYTVDVPVPYREVDPTATIEQRHYVAKHLAGSYDRCAPPGHGPSDSLGIAYNGCESDRFAAAGDHRALRVLATSRRCTRSTRSRSRCALSNDLRQPLHEFMIRASVEVGTDRAGDRVHGGRVDPADGRRRFLGRSA